MAPIALGYGRFLGSTLPLVSFVIAGATMARTDGTLPTRAAAELANPHAAETPFALAGADEHSAAPSPLTAQSKATVYACPMHPEVTSAAPGTCPKCGMKLEPRTP